MIALENRGDAVAASAAGEPPALFTSDVEAAEALDDGRRRPRSTCSASRTSAATNTSRPPGSVRSSGSCRPHDHDVGAGLEQALGDAPARRPRRRR